MKQKQRVHMICYVLVVQETCHENIETTLCHIVHIATQCYLDDIAKL